MSINFELSDGLQSEAGAVIKVISVGGGGGNAIENMINNKVENVEFICANTDVQALKKSNAPTILQLGEEITQGLGAGADPAVGARAAEESRGHIAQAISSANILFIAVGMGGGTGTGAAPVVAQLAKEQGILTVAVVTRPFSFEGRRRAHVAEAGIEALSKHVDSLITIPNDKLLSVLGKNISLLDAFKAANDVLQGAVQGIADLITRPGLINVDFADVKTVMSEMGIAMMGSGSATGKERAPEAAQAAISSPLLEDINLSGAKGVLVNISGGHDMSIGEFEAVGDVIRSFTSEDAIVVVGTVIEPDMIDELRVTVVVTGLENQPSPHPEKSINTAHNTSSSLHRPTNSHTSSTASSEPNSYTSTEARIAHSRTARARAAAASQTKAQSSPHAFQKTAAAIKEATGTARKTRQETGLEGSLNNDGTTDYKQLEKPTMLRQNRFNPRTVPSLSERYGHPTTASASGPPHDSVTTEYLDIPTFLRQKRQRDRVAHFEDDQ